MNGKKQIGVALIGDTRPLFESHVAVVGARVHHVAAHPLRDKRSQALRYIQREIFFQVAGGAMRSDIVAAVARVTHYPLQL